MEEEAINLCHMDRALRSRQRPSSSCPPFFVIFRQGLAKLQSTCLFDAVYIYSSTKAAIPKTCLTVSNKDHEVGQRPFFKSLLSLVFPDDEV